MSLYGRETDRDLRTISVTDVDVYDSDSRHSSPVPMNRKYSRTFMSKNQLYSCIMYLCPCTGARRTETCVAPRHIDASRDLNFIFSYEYQYINNERCGRWGEGGALPDYDFIFCSFSPVQQTASGIGHRAK